MEAWDRESVPRFRLKKSDGSDLFRAIRFVAAATAQAPGRSAAEVVDPHSFYPGTRDPLCPLDLLAEVRAEMRAPNELYVVEGGDHSLAVTKTRLRASGETQDQVDRRILERIRIFLESLEPA